MIASLEQDVDSMPSTSALAGFMLALLGAAPPPDQEGDDDLPPSESALSSTHRQAQPPPYKPFNLYSLISEEELRAELQDAGLPL